MWPRRLYLVGLCVPALQCPCHLDPLYSFPAWPPGHVGCPRDVIPIYLSHSSSPYKADLGAAETAPPGRSLEDHQIARTPRSRDTKRAQRERALHLTHSQPHRSDADAGQIICWWQSATATVQCWHIPSPSLQHAATVSSGAGLLTKTPWY